MHLLRLAGHGDERILAIVAAINDLQLIAALVTEQEERLIAEFQLHEGILLAEGLELIVLLMDDYWLWIVRGILWVVESEFIKDLLIEIADALHLIPLRALLLTEEARLLLTHAAGDLRDGLVDALIHVISLRASIDGDMVRAIQDDLGEVAGLMDIEDHLGLDDLRIIHIQGVDFLLHKVAECIGNGFVADGKGQGGGICSYLHN